MPSEGTQHVRFRLGNDTTGLPADLNLRTSSRLSRDLVARRDLERYYETLRRSLPRFTRGEAMAILDVCNGKLWEPWSVPLLWASVADAESLGAKWGIDQAALVERLRGLSYAECLSVADACERFWSYETGYSMDAEQTEAALIACGLARGED